MLTFFNFVTLYFNELLVWNVVVIRFLNKKISSSSEIELDL